MGNTQSETALKLYHLKCQVTELLGYAIATQFDIKVGGSHKPHHVEPDSFELSHNGEDFAGGSFYVKDNHLILASVTPQVDLGDLNDWETVKENIDKL